jgi:superfamily II DNA helicase RecQ
LPGSVEGYYQEIGRAGRDGLPSRAILMHSYSDRRTHDYFFERDYPDVAILDGIYAQLSAEPVAREDLAASARVRPEVFEKALEKLWTHGGALIDSGDKVTRGTDEWRNLYLAQAKHRADQVELMLRYVSSHRCRMAAIVHYFGDVTGSRRACGKCDHCAPELCVAQRFRPLAEWERTGLWKVLHHLRVKGSSTSGQLFKELYPSSQVTRRSFEALLGAMARTELLHIRSAMLERDGQQIPYRKISLTELGRSIEQDAPLRIVMKADSEMHRAPGRKRKPKNSSRTSVSQPGDNLPDRGLLDTLRQWRIAEARQRGVPAFCICTDQALYAIAREEPADDSDLLAIRGIGRQFVQKYGPAIYRLFNAPRESKR